MIPVDTLMEEAKCYLCLGNITLAQALELALLNRVAGGGEGAGYSVYTALISQAGGNAPTAIVLKNTIGNIVWSRDVAGEYRATLAGAFDDQKTWIDTPTNYEDPGGVVTSRVLDVNSVGLFTVTGGSPSDDLMNLYKFEIRVYP